MDSKSKTVTNVADRAGYHHREIPTEIHVQGVAKVLNHALYKVISTAESSSCGIAAQEKTCSNF